MTEITLKKNLLLHTIWQIKSYFYFKFDTSPSITSHNNSKLILIGGQILRELQLISILFDIKFEKYWAIGQNINLRNLKIIVNPGLLFEETFNWKIYFSLVSIIIGSSFFIKMVIRIFTVGFQQTEGKIKRGKNLVECWLILGGYYYLSGALVTYLAGFFSCSGGCDPIDIWMYLNLVSVIFIIIRVYYGIRTDFERRILKINFGCKRSNRAGSNGYLVNMGIIALFYYFREKLSPLNTSLLLLLGIFFNFVSRTKSQDYICQRMKNIEISLSTISAFISIALSTLIILEKLKIKQMKLMVFFIILFLILIKIYRSNQQTFTPLIKHLRNPHSLTSIQDMEAILFTFRSSKSFSNWKRDFINVIKEIFLIQFHPEEVKKLEDIPTTNNYDDEISSRKISPRKPISFFQKRTTQVRSASTHVEAYELWMTEEKLDQRDYKNYLFHQIFLKNFLINLNQTQKNQGREAESRISLFYLLFDFMNSKNEAKLQFTLLKKKNDEEMNLEQKLSLIRMENIVKNLEAKQLRKVQKEGEELDVNFLKIKNIFNISLEKTADIYSKLWSALGDMSPNIHKIRSLLLTSHSSIKNLKQIWKNYSSTLSHDINSMNRYARFLQQILREEEKGDILIKEAQILFKKTLRKKNRFLDFRANEDIKINSSPICLIEKTPNGLEIKSCNQQFSSLFNYEKNDLIEKKLDLLLASRNSFNFYMRKLKHEQIEDEGTTEFDKKKELLIFINKNNFLRAYSAILKPTPGEGGEKLLVMKLEMEKRSRPVAEILTTTNGRILAHNESASQIFNLDDIRLKSSGIKSMGDIAKEFDEVEYFDYVDGNYIQIFNIAKNEIQELFMKVRRPRDLTRSLLFTIIKQDDMKTTMLTRTLLTKNILTGEDLKKEDTSFLIHPAEREIKFCFTVDKNFNFSGKFYSKKEAEILEERITKERFTIPKQFIYTMKEKSMKHIHTLGMENNFGQGIRVKRLFDERICDLHEFDDLESELDHDEDLMEEKIKNRKKLMEKTIGIFTKKKKFKTKAYEINSRFTEKTTKRNILKILNRKKTPKQIKIFSFFNFIILVFSITVFLISSSLVNTLQHDSQNYFEIFSRCTIRNVYMKQMFQRVFDIKAAEKGIHPYFPYKEKYPLNIFVEENMKNFFEDNKKMDSVVKEVNEFYFDVSTSAIESILSDKALMVNIKGQNSKFSYLEFFEMIKANSGKVINKVTNKVEFLNQEVFFNLENLHKYIFYTRILTGKIKEGKGAIGSRFTSIKDFITILFLVQSFLSIIILSCLYKLVLKKAEEKIKCFYSFKEEYITRRAIKCEEYLSILFIEMKLDDTEFNDNNLSLPSQKSEKEEDEDSFFFFKKKKIVKGKLATIFNIFSLFIFVLVIFNYYLVIVDLDFHDQVLFKLGNMTDYIMKFGMYFNNLQFNVLSMASVMIYPRKAINGVPTKKFYAKESMTFKMAYRASFQGIIQMYQEDKQFFDGFQKLFMTPRCGDDMLDEYKDEEEEFRVKCSDILGGAMKYDLLTPISLHYDNTLVLIQRYIAILNAGNSKKLTFNEKCQDFPQEASILNQNLKCLYTSQLLVDLKIFFEQYFFPTLKKINIVTIQSMKAKMAEKNAKALVFESIFIVSQFGIFVVVVVLGRKVKREVRILNLIFMKIFAFHHLMQYHDLKDVRQNERLKKFYRKNLVRGV